MTFAVAAEPKTAHNTGPKARPMTGCRMAVLEGELNAGKGFSTAIGNGLRLWFQPIASGWILRVGPLQGMPGKHDYAELATPPYRSVTPLSLSTDFSFRAQDAVGWNPRRFRFATSAEAFAVLERTYARLPETGSALPPELEAELTEEVSHAAEGKLTIIDARLEPGTGDQWRAAAAVSSRFLSTAHTLVPSASGRMSPLGKLLWVRFRVELDMPPRFEAGKGLHVVPHLCGSL